MITTCETTRQWRGKQIESGEAKLILRNLDILTKPDSQNHKNPNLREEGGIIPITPTPIFQSVSS